MYGCEGCRALMLEHLYDLLDEAESQAFGEHLAGCTACQAAQASARRQQQLLASAARLSLPSAPFVPPAPQAAPAQSITPAVAPPATLPLRPEAAPVRRGARLWRRWAAAAAVLLALGGLVGVPAYREERAYEQDLARLDAQQKDVDEALEEAKEVDAKLEQAKTERARQVKDIRETANKEGLKLDAVVPGPVLAGGGTEIFIRHTDLNGRPVPTEVKVEFLTEQRPKLGGAGTGALAAKAAANSARPFEPRYVSPSPPLPGWPPMAGPAKGPGKSKTHTYPPTAPVYVSPGGAPVTVPPHAPPAVPPPPSGLAPAGPQPGTAVTLPSGDFAPGGGEWRARNHTVTTTVRAVPVAAGLSVVVVPKTLDVNNRIKIKVSARRANSSVEMPSETVTLKAPTFATHLTTDKPMYQPGEVVHFRSLTLDRFSLTPAGEDFRLVYSLTTPLREQRLLALGRNVFREEKGNLQQVLGPDAKAVHGVGAGEFVLPPDAPGGEYALTVREERNRFPAVTRKFLVNRYQKPRLDKVLEYGRKTYGPGDEVLATAKARRADGGPVKDRPAHARVVVDDRGYGPNGELSAVPFALRTDEDGKALVRFKLPTQVERGQASLAVTFDDGGTVETIVRPIPIVLRKLDVELYPEGGDLVAGLPNRVYFQARTSLGKPADLRGWLRENGQRLPIEVATLTDLERPGVNQGLGCFTFVPHVGRTYEVEVESPAGINQRFALPEARADGVVLSVPQGFVEAGKPIRAVVRSTHQRPLFVGAYCRGRLLAHQQLAPGQTEAILVPASGAGGVCRVTVFEEHVASGATRELRPVAERLIYRDPVERVDVDLRPDKRRYVPGEKVKVSVAATDEREKFKAILVMLRVVDRSVVTLADDKTDRSMPADFLLATEVQRPEDLEYADFLLSGHPKAAVALDLLLGTQGWRRFAEARPEAFLEAARGAAAKAGKQRRQAEEAERLLVMSGRAAPRTIDLDRKKIAKINQDFAAKEKGLLAARATAQAAARAKADSAEGREARAAVARHQERLDTIRRVGVPGLTVALVLAALALLVRGLSLPARRAWPHLAGVTASVGLVVLLSRVPAPEGPPAPPDAGELAGVDTSKGDAGEGRDAPEDQLRDRGEADRSPKGERAKADTKEARRPDAELTAAPKFGFPGGPFGMAATTASAALDGKSSHAGGKGGALYGGFGQQQQANPYLLGLGVNDEAARPDVTHAYAERRALLAHFDKAKETKEQDRPGLRAEKKRALMAGADAFFYEDNPARKDADRLGRARQAELLRRRLVERGGRGLATAPPLVVREYAHRRVSGTDPALRGDFAETLYWHPLLVLPNGKGEVTFDLCDSVTSFTMTAFAHTLDGRLGATTKVIESRLPVVLSPKAPLEVTTSDRIDLPLSVANTTTEKRTVEVALKQHAGLALERGAVKTSLAVGADKVTRQLYRFHPTLSKGEALLAFEGKTNGFAADAVKQAIKVVPDGFPVTEARSDLLEGGQAAHKVEMPARWVKGTLALRADVFPSTLADLQKGLEGLLREPNGCFEQASTSNYPNVLILDYLKESGQGNPEVEKRARDLLDKGYRRLASYECREPAGKAKRGYEWFGGTAPPHEALTAYGLLQFRDMARVHEVDGAMLKRTRDYLLGQRDGKGGFRRNPRAIDTFGRAPEHVTNAYIVWALTEGGKEDLSLEQGKLLRQAHGSSDPYFLALVANGLLNRGRATDVAPLLKRLGELQKDDGSLQGTETSITGSRERDLKIETTALAVLAWLKANQAPYAGNVAKATRWLGQQRGGHGAFGSTQGTILALKALIAHARANRRPVESGELRLYVGDALVARKAFTGKEAGTLSLEAPDAEKRLRPGNNRVRLEVTGRNAFPYTLAWSYRGLTPASPAGCPVRLETALEKKEAREGDLVRLKVKLENRSGRDQGMAVAVVGLPGGLSLPEDLKQLKQHTAPRPGRPLLGAFEVKGRELVLYWRDLHKDERVEVPVDLVCRVPGSYRGPASRAYLYYNADRKHWVSPLEVAITAKAPE